MLNSEAAIALYHMENIALINFSTKEVLPSIQVLLDEDGKLLPPKLWPILSTYQDFLNWALQLNPREFDNSMALKHPTDGKKGFGSNILCTHEEVLRIMRFAFYKKADHENHLFFYHLPKEDRPILWFKAASRSYHGFHISDADALMKGIDISELKNYSEYIISLLDNIAVKKQP